MFGKNIIRQPKHFENIGDGNLLVTSIFRTIQGEGPFAGRSAVFVRLAMCNLACSFCDTYFDKGDVMSIDAVFAAIEKTVEGREHRRQRQLVVVTGGEPTIQPNITKFVNRLQERQYMAQVESNGIIARDVSQAWLVLSPKVNETTHEYIMPHESMIRRADSMKFIVSATEPGYTDLPKFGVNWNGGLSGISRSPLFISPMAVYAKKPRQFAEDGSLEGRNENEVVSFWEPGLLDMAACEANYRRAAMLALKYDATLSIQMHLFAGIA